MTDPARAGSAAVEDDAVRAADLAATDPCVDTENAVEAVRDNFVQLWGALGTFWGVSPTTARVYGYLLSRSEPADAEEIMAGLELSRGAVSMAARELRDWHLVLPEKVPGSRRVLYRPETDLEKVVKNVVQIRKRREWDPILEHLDEWLPRLEACSSPEAKVFRERLQALAALVVLADSMAEAFLKGGTVGSIGLKALAGMARRRQRSKSSTGVAAAHA